MNGKNLLKASLVAIPLMGVPAGAASAECPPTHEEEAVSIEVVIVLEAGGPAIPAWGEGDRSEVPAGNPVRLLTDMRDPANSLIEPVSGTLLEP